MIKQRLGIISAPLKNFYPIPDGGSHPKVPGFLHCLDETDKFGNPLDITPLMVMRCLGDDWVVCGNRRLKALKECVVASGRPVRLRCIVHEGRRGQDFAMEPFEPHIANPSSKYGTPVAYIRQTHLVNMANPSGKYGKPGLVTRANPSGKPKPSVVRREGNTWARRAPVPIGAILPVILAKICQDLAKISQDPNKTHTARKDTPTTTHPDLRGIAEPGSRGRRWPAARHLQ